MNYHIARDGQQLGVYPREDILARYQSGEIRATDLAWSEGQSEWKPVGEIFGPAPTAGTGAPPPPPLAASATPVRPVAMAQPVAGLPPKPDNNLVWAILSTLLCCLPLGVVSIVYSTQVDGKYLAGDYDGAVKAARAAKNWAIASAISLAGVVLIYLIVMGVMAALAVGAANTGY